ncbi:MAG: cytochrome c [Gemmatimonadota bacterium]|nr:cytochrome c [Gemmatimonadota bacterium]
MQKRIGHGRRPVLLGPGVLALFVLGGCASSGVPDPGSPPGPEPQAPAEAPEPEAVPVAAASAGLYTETQATRGGEIFESVCSECHTTSEFRGRSFQADWGRRSVYSFYRTVRSTMPDDNPGGLSEQVYLDVVAYILDMNGHAPGPGELSAESPMRDVRIDPDFGGPE